MKFDVVFNLLPHKKIQDALFDKLIFQLLKLK